MKGKKIEFHPWEVDGVVDGFEVMPPALEAEEEDVVLANPSSLKPDVQW